MYCIHCGHQLPNDAAFCSACGKPVQGGEAVKAAVPIEQVTEKCHIELWEQEAKWSLFGKTTNKFQAIDDNGNILLESEKFKMTGFSYDGPEETSKKYRDMMDKMVLELAMEGWKKLPGHGRHWYELSFERIVKD